MAEQLYYAWTRRGPDGRSGFQIVAATAGLRDRRAPMTQLALKFCRYDAAEGINSSDEPVSFGWVDEGELRVVFHRVGAERVNGRPGGFCAHVIIGRREDLPVSLIATWYGSPLWWTKDQGGWDEPERCQLPPLDPNEVIPGRLGQLDESASAAFLAALLSLSGGSLALPVPSAQAAGLVAIAERAVPGLLEEFSFSSYEADSRAREFSIVGVGADHATPAGTVRLDGDGSAQGHRLTRIASAFLHGELPNALARSALMIAFDGVRVNRPILVGAAETLSVIDSGGDIDQENLADFVSAPGAMGALLARAEGLNVVARALAGEDDNSWRALSAAEGSTPADSLARLAVVLTRSLAEMSGLARLGACLRRARGVSVAFNRDLIAAVLNACWEQPALIALLDEAGVLALLRSLAKRAKTSGSDQDEVSATLIRHAGHTDAIGRARELPVDWRAAAIAASISAGRSPAAFLDPLASDAGLLVAVARKLPSAEPLLTLIEKVLTPQAEPMALALAPILTPGEVHRLLSAVYNNTPLDDRISFIARCAAHDAAMLAGAGHLVSLAVAEGVLARHADMAEPAGLTDVEVKVLLDAGGLPGARWLAFWQRVVAFSGPPANLIDDAVATFGDLKSAEGAAAQELALDRGILISRSDEQLAELVVRYGRGRADDDGSVAVRLLIGALRSLAGDESGEPAQAVGTYVESLLTSGSIEFARDESKDEAIRLFSELSSRIPQDSSDGDVVDGAVDDVASPRSKLTATMWHRVDVLRSASLVRRPRMAAGRRRSDARGAMKQADEGEA